MARLILDDEQVNALLNGQTVRVTAPVTDGQIARYNTFAAAQGHEGVEGLAEAWGAYALTSDDMLFPDARRFKSELLSLSPFGGLGNELWVAEAWKILSTGGVFVTIEYRADGRRETFRCFPLIALLYTFCLVPPFRATRRAETMPRGFSRFTVMVTASSIGQAATGWQWWAEVKRNKGVRLP